jgi:hypothetical protein
MSRSAVAVEVKYEVNVQITNNPIRHWERLIDFVQLFSAVQHGRYRFLGGRIRGSTMAKHMFNVFEVAVFYNRIRDYD